MESQKSRALSILAGLAALLFSCMIPSAQGEGDSASTADQKPGLVIMPFTPNGDVTNILDEKDLVPFGLELSGRLIASLVNDGYDQVRKNDDLANVLKEQNLTDKGVIDPKTAAHVGQIMGARYLVETSITGFKTEQMSTKSPIPGLPLTYHGVRYTVQLSALLQEVDSDRSMFPTDATGVLENKSIKMDSDTKIGSLLNSVTMKNDQWLSTDIGVAAQKAVDSLARSLVRKLSGEASVTMVMDKDQILFMDKGQNDHVQEGDAYDVYAVKDVLDDKGKVVFQNTVKIGSASVAAGGLNPAKSMLKITSVEPGQKIEDRQKDHYLLRPVVKPDFTASKSQ